MSQGDLMKAILHTRFGSPELLQFGEVETPTPGVNEVLVKVSASSLNFGDVALIKGQPFLIRLMGFGLFRPKHLIPGGDLAGVVEAVGEKVSQFHPGDSVFADIGDAGMGAYAQYVVVPEDVLVRKPENITFEQAAAVPQAAVVALQGLRDNGELKAGDHVLINGASGGVGSFAVQIANALGAEVTAVCSAKNHDLVSKLGADHVIDYRQVDFTQQHERYDVIFDIVANRSISKYMKVLTAKGRYVACAFNASSLFFGGFLSKSNGKKASSLIHKPNRQDLAFIGDLLEQGKVVPVIDRTYPLSDISEAMLYLDSGRHYGKIVITI